MGNGEGLGDALKYVGELVCMVRDMDILEVAGRTYAPKALSPVKDPEVDALKMTTLAGLVDYLTLAAEHDGFGPENVLVHVVGPRGVAVRSRVFGPFRQREDIVNVVPETPDFSFGRHLNSENFVIGVNSMFVKSPARDELLRRVSAIKIEDGADIVDDGVSQKVTVSAGARLVDMQEMPPIWELEPHCSFPDLAAPTRQFLLRLNKEGMPALYEADGGTWRGPHMQRIKEWLDKALNGEGEKRLEPGWLVVA